MQETTKTICFVVTAAVLGVAAVGNSWMNQPGNSVENELLGKPFYPDFTSTEAARSLEVCALDPDSGSLQRFSVENNGDLWRIPTHYDYPAEAAARIAETSASVMGLERQAMVGVSESEFEKFGVVDPLSDEIEDPAAAGKRITLKDENNETLVDYIIGNEIENESPTTQVAEDFNERGQTSEFYVRRAEDSQTYRVSLDIDLSTRFSDWIDPDLLRIDRPDVTYISINNYSLEERGAGTFGRVQQLVKIQGDQVNMRRTSPAAKWSVANMHPTNEEVNLGRIDEILGVLDQMKMTGVRPKFKFEDQQLLKADLTLAEIPELQTDREKASYAIQALQQDLMSKGFNVSGTQEKIELASENGEIEFGTAQGLRYKLHIGGSASSEDDSIEIGSAAKDADESKSDTEASSETDSEGESTIDDSDRFLFVGVTFDESLLVDRPVEPKLPDEPTKPEGYVPFDESKSEDVEDKPETEESEVTKDSDGAESKKDGEGDSEEASDTTAADDRDPRFIAYDAAVKAYETAKGEHEMNLTRFKQDTEVFEEKIAEGKKLVEELNQRFGDWYYVISASNLRTLQSKREDVVNFVEPETKDGEAGMPVKPELSIPKLPVGGSTFGKEEAPAKSEPTSESSGSKDESETESSKKETPKKSESDAEMEKAADTATDDTKVEKAKQASDEKESDSKSKTEGVKAKSKKDSESAKKS